MTPIEIPPERTVPDYIDGLKMELRWLLHDMSKEAVSDTVWELLANELPAIRDAIDALLERGRNR